MLTHSCLNQPKLPDNFGDILQKQYFKKIFEGELFIEPLSTTLLHMFYKLIPKFFFESLKGFDDTGKIDLRT